MCQLLKSRVAKENLPLPPPYDKMWMKIKKIIDALHISNHVDPVCKRALHPDTIYNDYPDLKGTRNTQVGEQTFVWMARLKKNYLLNVKNPPFVLFTSNGKTSKQI